MYYIYRITNLINGKTYIGQHKYKDLNDSYMGSGILLHKAYKKYGIENFKKEILYSNIQYKETVDDMERFAIAKERAVGKAEYNIADGGQSGINEEIKKKISKTKQGHLVSKETRKKISEANKGKCLSEETRKKISEARNMQVAPMKGKHHSEETRKRISESNKGKSSWVKGKHCSEEHKRKISEAIKGKHRSEETRRKMSKAKKGQTISEEQKKKISETWKGSHWFNNGTKNVRAKTCPEGFVPGRL